jgi:hypothetical protein
MKAISYGFHGKPQFLISSIKKSLCLWRNWMKFISHICLSTLFSQLRKDNLRVKIYLYWVWNLCSNDSIDFIEYSNYHLFKWKLMTFSLPSMSSINTCFALKQRQNPIFIYYCYH